jgi:type II secretory pathway component PulM
MNPLRSPFDSFQRLNPRERRVVAAGTIVSVVLLTTVWLVLPLEHRWSDRAVRLSAAHDRWERLSTLVASASRLRQTLDAAHATSAGVADQLVAGATPALAASSLQEVLQHDAGQSAVQLERVDAAGDPHADKPGLLAIPVQLQARGDLYGLVDFLGRLEQGNPLLVVDELTVNAGPDPADEGPGAGGSPQALSWTLRLHGLYEGSAEGSP